MTTSATVLPNETAEQPVPIRAHGTVVKRLGHWTQRRQIDVRGSRATIVLDLRRIGRCTVKDWMGTAAATDRHIVLTGELRSAGVRVQRGGVAILSAMCSRGYFADAIQARREGRFPTIDDPTR